MKTLQYILVILVITLSFGGCSGSSDSSTASTDSVTVDNNEPTITSDATISVNENQTSAFTITATDEDGDTLTYSLSGDDASSFDLDASLGVVTFKVAPDYETKSSYSLTVIASDSEASDSQSVTLNITNLTNVFQTVKIEASDGATSDQFGKSICVSGDYTVVGSANADSKEGAVYLYKRQSNDSMLEIAKLQANDAEANDYFGYSVAIDGNYIVVGAYKEDTNATDAGSVYIFRKDSDDTVTQIAKIQASDAEADDYFGTSVSISGDYIVVGAYGEDTNATDAGSTYIFKINLDDDFTQIAKIQASDAEADDYFGTSVSISGDYIVVGANEEDTNGTNAGSAYVFKINSDTDVTQIAKIQDSDAGAYNYFGNSVSIDGEYIAVAAKGDSEGSVYIFQIKSDSNISQISKIQANDGEVNDLFGISVSISGNYIAVGASGNDTAGFAAGSAYLFKIDSDTNVSQIAKIQAHDAQSYDEFGYAVAISGRYFAVGAYYKNEEIGAAYLYDIEASGAYIYNSPSSTVYHSEELTNTAVYNFESASSSGGSITYTLSSTDASSFYMSENTLYYTSTQDYETPTDSDVNNNFILSLSITDTDSVSRNINIEVNVEDKNYLFLKTITSDDIASGDKFGDSVSVSGNYIIAGAPSKNSYAGVAYVYEKQSDNTMLQIAKLQLTDAQSRDYFGYCVSISGNYIVVGAKAEDTNATDAGSAYLFKIETDNSVTQIAELYASDAQASDFFGKSVSISGDYIIVGSDGEDTGGDRAGSAYIFKRNSDTNVTQIAKIQANDPESYDYFGNSVSIDIDYITVGAYGEDTKGDSAGSAYIFKINSDDNVTEIAKIQASDAETNDYFGKSVSISGNYIAVGAYGEDTNATEAGSAYIFKINSDTNVSEIAKVQASEPQAYALFGESIVINGDHIIVGAASEDINEVDEGSAYLFKINSDNSVTQLDKLKAINAEIWDTFGSSVAMDNNTIAIGVTLDTTTEANSGSVYIFVPDTNQP